MATRYTTEKGVLVIPGGDPIPKASRVTVRVYHGFYGCDTGCCGHCCGHVVRLDKDGKFHGEHFKFDHPESKEARELAEKVIGRYWPDCLDSIDWTSLEVDLGCYEGVGLSPDQAKAAGLDKRPEDE